MTVASWPSGLAVRWRQEGYNLTPDREPSRTDVEDGLARSRRRLSVRLGKVESTLRFTRAEYENTFEPFWRNTLFSGSVPWTMPVYAGGAANVTRVVKSTRQYTVSWRGSRVYVGLALEVVNP